MICSNKSKGYLISCIYVVASNPTINVCGNNIVNVVAQNYKESSFASTRINFVNMLFEVYLEKYRTLYVYNISLFDA